MKKDITLTVKGRDIDFEVDAGTYEKYLDEMTLTKKMVPAKNFLMRSVKEESRETLKAVLQLPGSALHLAGALVEEYAPDFDVSVGKSKSGLNSSEIVE